MKKIARILTLASCIAVLSVTASCGKEDNGQDNGQNNRQDTEQPSVHSYKGYFEELYSYFNKTISSSDSANIATEFIQQGFSVAEDDRPGLRLEKNLASGERIEFVLVLDNNVVEDVQYNIRLRKDGSGYMIEEYKDDLITHLNDLKSFVQKHNMSPHLLNMEGDDYNSIDELISDIPGTRIHSDCQVQYTTSVFRAKCDFDYGWISNRIVKVN